MPQGNTQWDLVTDTDCKQWFFVYKKTPQGTFKIVVISDVTLTPHIQPFTTAVAHDSLFFA